VQWKVEGSKIKQPATERGKKGDFMMFDKLTETILEYQEEKEKLAEAFFETVTQTISDFRHKLSSLLDEPVSPVIEEVSPVIEEPVVEEAQKKKPGRKKGLKMSGVSKKKIKDTLSGRVLTAEHKKKIGLGVKKTHDEKKKAKIESRMAKALNRKKAKNLTAK